VLTLRFDATQRPAAPCRRPFPLPLALLALLALLAVLAAAGCGPGHVPDVDGARAAAARAVRELRATSPSQARYVERLVAAAETATAGELASPSWRRDTGRAAAAWLRALRAAREATHSQRSVAAQSRSRYRELLGPARNDVARARSEVRETGMGRREGAAMERAEVALATAERLAAAGVWDQAVDKLRKAREDVAVVHATWLGLHARFSDPALRRQWRGMADAVIAESRDRQSFAIVVDKLRRELILYYRGLRMASYHAELGANGLRRKEYSGDRATPEGIYRVVDLKQGKRTKYYKALLIDYPNADDRIRYQAGKRRGSIPRRAGIGSLIEIHGDGGTGEDWTDGCVALSNDNMDDVFARSRLGMPVAIVGTYAR